MNRREPQLLVVLPGRLFVLGLDIGEQRELRQEILDRRELLGKDGQLFQVLQPRAVVGEVFLQVIVVAGVNHQPDHLRGARAGRLRASSCAMVATNCAQATAAFFGTTPAQACSAHREGRARCVLRGAWRRVLES